VGLATAVAHALTMLLKPDSFRISGLMVRGHALDGRIFLIARKLGKL
jgi:hypothetical protein